MKREKGESVMPDGAEFDSLAESVVSACKGYLAKALVRVGERIDLLEKRLTQIPAGPQGERGLQGERGDAGPIGERGLQGERGDVGAQGPAGERGVQGADGVGVIGPQGERGMPGPDGAQGAQGPQGEPGVKGDTGAAGARGERGSDGVDGAAGIQGERGERGEAGARGEPGAVGEKGMDGAPGAAGERGEPGERGQLGPVGEKGMDGAPGAVGERGAPGERGEPGPQGIKGFDGLPGINGSDGVNGRDGVEGQPGRDALHIDVLDGIDATRTYARGTFATYMGGLLRATRPTDAFADGEFAKAGWQVIVEGMADFGLELADDQRSVAVGAQLTSGRTISKVLPVPAMVYRDIWNAETHYVKNDTATWDGSMWICRTTGTTLRPGEGNNDWKLIAKRGRDGRDGTNGKDGAPGPEGRRGRDGGTY